MSLAINLILNLEQRSGSKFNLRTLGKIAAVSIPLLVVTVILQQGLIRFVLTTNLSTAKTRWAAAEPRQQYAQKQQARLNQNRLVLEEILAWQATQPQWDAALVAIMQTAPEDTHINFLRVQAPTASGQSSQKSPPTRNPSIRIEGRVGTQNAMNTIPAFRNQIEQHPLLQDRMDRVEIVNFGADAQSDNPYSRIFSIIARLNQLGESP